MSETEENFDKLLENPGFWMAALSIFFLAFVELMNISGDNDATLCLLRFVVGLLIVSILFLFSIKFKELKQKRLRIFRWLFMLLAVIILIIILGEKNFTPIGNRLSLITSNFLSELKKPTFWNGLVFFGVVMITAVFIDWARRKITKKEIISSVIYIIVIFGGYFLFKKGIFSLLNFLAGYSTLLTLAYLGIFWGLALYSLAAILNILVPVFIWLKKRIKDKIKMGKSSQKN